jgi:hypothetical protein
MCSRRPTSRRDIKSNIPEQTDLYGLGGKYPNIDDLRDILTDGIKHGIPGQRAVFRKGPVTPDKGELLSRILVYPYTRQLLVDWLIENNKVLEDSELSSFYLQFCQKGRKFEGDIGESIELQKEAGIEIISDKKEAPSTDIDNELYELVWKTVADVKGEKIEPERAEILKKILKIYATLETEELEKEFLNL